MLTEVVSLFWKSRKRWLYSLLAVVAALGVNLSTPQVSQAGWGNVLRGVMQGVQAVQISNLSNEQEVALGQQINQQLLQSGVKIYNNKQINDYVNAIGQRLAKNCGRTDIPYTFQVVDDASINAFATMGGMVYVNKGLITTAENESELASVIGHEIGHVVGRHSIKQMRETLIAQGVMSGVGVDSNVLANIGVDIALHLPHSRKHELEADQLGLANIIKAGYAPIGMVTFMQKLEKSGPSMPAIISTHPNTGERVERLSQAIAPDTANVGDGLDNKVYLTNIQALVK